MLRESIDNLLQFDVVPVIVLLFIFRFHSFYFFILFYFSHLFFFIE